MKYKYTLLKSKDDFSFEHYPASPLSKMTGFTGTAGEAVQDEAGCIVLFVDPRYHIQAQNQTKNRNVTLICMKSQSSLLKDLKKFLPKYSTLYVPAKSTSYAFYKELKECLKTITILTYSTPNVNTAISNPASEIFSVPFQISGEDVADKIKKLGIHNYFITNLEEIAYLLNLRSFKIANSATFRAKLFIRDEENIYLFCDYRLPPLPLSVSVMPLGEYGNFIKRQKKSVSFDANLISLHDFSLINKPASLKKNPVAKIASVKNSNEIEHYKESYKRLCAALYKFKGQIKAGLSEFELNEIFERALLKEGAVCTSFKTILAIGENTSIIHYTGASKNKILQPGEIVLLDCGGYYRGGYATDITRVFKCGSEINPIVKEIYTAVLKALLNAYNSDFLTTDKLYSLAYRILKKYEKTGFFFPHGLGHGIGIPVHQSPPVLSAEIKQKIKNGSVFTIEPGLYKPGQFGIRLENAVYLKEGKKIALSLFPFEEDLINHDQLAKTELSWLDEWNSLIKEG